MDELTTIGARLRVLRRWRGMTLTELGGLSGLSPSFLSMAERGQRLLDRRSHIAAIATALRVSEVELTGRPGLMAAREKNGPHDAVPGLQAALASNTLGDSLVERARSLPDLTAAAARLVELKQRVDYTTLGHELPSVIDEVHHHIATARGERELATALRLLIDVSHPAATVSAMLGYPDLARLATRHALDAARLLDDPLYRGLTDFLHTMTTPRAGAWDRIFDLSTRATDRLASARLDGPGVQVHGMLHLTAAFAAASDLRSDAAAGHLAEAQALAGRVRADANAFGLSFNAANVGVWRVMVTAELGDYGRAAELATQVDASPLPLTRRSHLYAEAGRALAHVKGKERQAITLLRQAEDVAPQRIRNSTAVKGTVSYLLSRARSESVNRELRGLASRMGVPH
ncbi:helix-turn-helix domain-containing protein [Actinocorallia sp. API 0066]|uniref:helix-turn-helix domain-containing protein n=1 Tax=Actinocorallia sp. API 0066 TaxID=2896846 RepID=UPI001E3A34F3|nr:helix-turn-helix domain-containing protein [Actinocorallia sp. API 0066]MCD0448722.1 helix-turn-helix domain-containing protein [Actinocorallia sp. API 0066]